MCCVVVQLGVVMLFCCSVLHQACYAAFADELCDLFLLYKDVVQGIPTRNFRAWDTTAKHTDKQNHKTGNRTDTTSTTSTASTTSTKHNKPNTTKQDKTTTAQRRGASANILLDKIMQNASMTDLHRHLRSILLPPVSPDNFGYTTEIEISGTQIDESN